MQATSLVEIQAATSSCTNRGINLYADAAPVLSHEEPTVSLHIFVQHEFCTELLALEDQRKTHMETMDAGVRMGKREKGRVHADRAVCWGLVEQLAGGRAHASCSSCPPRGTRPGALAHMSPSLLNPPASRRHEQRGLFVCSASSQRG